MLNQEISAKLKKFIFLYVDSVELIEVLLYLHKFSETWFSPVEISLELRSNPNSISNRLSKLISIGFLEQNKNQNQFRFKPANEELKKLHLNFLVSI